MFKGCYSLNYLYLSNFNSKEIKSKNGFFHEKETNSIVIYNSSIFKNIKNFILNEGIIFIDVNIDLYF